MKHVTLIRHAKSSWKDTGLPDIQRPLHRRGERDAPHLAARLARSAWRPEVLLVSPARRARDTGALFAKELGTAAGPMIERQELYGATAGELLAVLQGLEDKIGHVALCAHNPGLSELARLLAGRPLPDLPTCGVVTLELPVEGWRELGLGSARILRLDTPKGGEQRSPAG